MATAYKTYDRSQQQTHTFLHKNELMLPEMFSVVDMEWMHTKLHI